MGMSCLGRILCGQKFEEADSPLSGARELRYNSTEDVRVCFGDETGTV